MFIPSFGWCKLEPASTWLDLQDWDLKPLRSLIDLRIVSCGNFDWAKMFPKSDQANLCHQLVSHRKEIFVFTTLFEKSIFWEEHFDQAVHFKTALLMVEIWKNQSPGSRATLMLHTSLPWMLWSPYKQLPPRSVWRSLWTAPAPAGSHGFQELGYGAQQPFWTALLLMEKIQGSPVEVGPLSHYFQGFIHPRWLFKISEPSTILIVGNNQSTWPSLKSPLQLEHWTLRAVNISIKAHSFPKHLRNSTLILLDSWCHRFLVWA